MSDKYTNPDFAEYTAEQQFREEVAEHLAVTPPDSRRRGPREIDNAYREDSQPVRRFYMRRMKDETGISRTGRVLEGIVTQSGRVIVEWRPPHSTLGIYRDMAEFQTIHVDCHPSCNEIVWLDAALAASAPVAPPEDFQGYCDRCGARGVMVTDVGSEDLCVNCRAVAAAPPEPAIYCPRCNLSSADVETLLREAAAPPAGGTLEAERRAIEAVRLFLDPLTECRVADLTLADLRGVVLAALARAAGEREPFAGWKFGPSFMEQATGKPGWVCPDCREPWTAEHKCAAGADRAEREGT